MVGLGGGGEVVLPWREVTVGGQGGRRWRRPVALSRRLVGLMWLFVGLSWGLVRLRHLVVAIHVDWLRARPGLEDVGVPALVHQHRVDVEHLVFEEVENALLGVLFGVETEGVSGVLDTVRRAPFSGGEETIIGVGRAHLRRHQAHHQETHPQHHAPCHHCVIEVGRVVERQRGVDVAAGEHGGR